MLTSGTDAVAGRHEKIGIRYADDMVSMPLQCGTQWDALGHIFFGEKMWNGYDARLVDSTGAEKNGIEKTTRQDGRPRRAAGHRPLQGRRFAERRLRHQHRRSGKLRGRAKSGNPAKAISSFSAPGTWSAASQLANGAAMRAATLPACDLKPPTGFAAPTSPPSAPTRGVAKCVPTKPTNTSASPGTGSSFP